MKPMYIVCLVKWSGDGEVKHHLVGATKDLHLAQSLMVDKALFLARWHGQLDGHVLTSNGEFQGESKSVNLGGAKTGAQVLPLLIESGLATDRKVRLQDGKHGFAIKIKETKEYNSRNLGEAQSDWSASWRAKMQKKIDRLKEKFNDMADRGAVRALRSGRSPARRSIY